MVLLGSSNLSNKELRYNNCMKDNLNKLVGFAETLFTGKNKIHAVAKNSHTVSEATQKRCFAIALDRSNNGGYFVNLSNHTRG